MARLGLRIISANVMTRPLKQIAALPIVETDKGPLVLLITTRRRGRWTIPKGWPKRGLADSEMAAREAFEEAGVQGDVHPRPVGKFRYTKRLHVFSWVKCAVEVYPLHVRLHQTKWREKGTRKMRWVSPDAAASIVADTELAVLLRDFFQSKST